MSSAAASITPQAKPVQSPLTLVMKIKSPQAYQELIGLLTQLQAQPADKNPLSLALNSLRNVHFARFVFMHDNTELAVITTYDGTFEDYINEFVDAIGDIFNELLARMDPAPPLPVQQNRDAFLVYVKANDLQCVQPFYSSYPEATVLDIQAALSAQA
jgi:hypothetical protein